MISLFTLVANAFVYLLLASIAVDVTTTAWIKILEDYGR